MPFPPLGLSRELESKLDVFRQAHDLSELYKQYAWGLDTWCNGFPDILKLELDTGREAKSHSLLKTNVLSIVEWGNLRNVQNVKCPDTLVVDLYEDNRPSVHLEDNPIGPLKYLYRQGIKGLGPTYLSKVLRFALPSEFGAIDTRIVRVFGLGDASSQKHDWLRLRVRNYGSGWHIPKVQAAWPEGYSVWVNVLRFFARALNDARVVCPQPQDFVASGLREEGRWVCADVEMALFAYATKCLESCQHS